MSKATRSNRQLISAGATTSFEVEKTITITRKTPKQVGIKLVTQQSQVLVGWFFLKFLNSFQNDCKLMRIFKYYYENQVRVYSVVPGSLAYSDGRLKNGDILLRVSGNSVRSSDEAAREIGRVKNEHSITLQIARIANQKLKRKLKIIRYDYDFLKVLFRPHLIIPDAQSSRVKPTINSKWARKWFLEETTRRESGAQRRRVGLFVWGSAVFVLDIKQKGLNFLFEKSEVFLSRVFITMAKSRKATC